MKRLLPTLLLSLLTVGIINAQTDDSQKDSTTYTTEYGIDAFFINRFLPLERNIGAGSPYLFNMQKWDETGRLRRMGLNINLSGAANSKENDANVTFHILATSYRYGWGKRRPAFKNATWSLGTDIIVNPEYQTLKRVTNPQNIEDVITIKTLNLEVDIGGGPWVGFQYDFTEKIGLYTELTAYLSVTYEYQKYGADDESIEGYENSFLEYRNRYSLPISMVVFFKL